MDIGRPFNIRRKGQKDLEWVRELLRKEWGATVVVTRGKKYDADLLPGFIAEREGGRCGLITYNISGNDLEIITLNSLAGGIGIGSALLEQVKEEMKKSGCRRIWLITTNDNVNAIGFYERKGFRTVAIHKDAIEESRKLKPDIPLTGFNGMPIRDEIEMELSAGAGKDSITAGPV
jgi:ribosomal protein S18 acetylase RimI-like enzyme